MTRALRLWLVALSAALSAGIASAQVAAGRQAEKLSGASDEWTFFFGAYGYLSAGVRTDHEVTNLPEAREKLAKGMQLLIREGSVSKDLHALASIITQPTT